MCKPSSPTGGAACQPDTPSHASHSSYADDDDIDLKLPATVTSAAHSSSNTFSSLPPIYVYHQGILHNLAPYIARHPGGQLIAHLRGDITWKFYQMHGKDDRAKAVLRTLRVVTPPKDTHLYPVPANDLLPVDQELTVLQAKWEAEGLFEHSWLPLIQQAVVLLLTYSLFVLCTYVYPARHSLGLVFLALSSFILFWLLHDLGHYEVFDTKQGNQKWLAALGILLLGADGNSVTDEHLWHHVFTNVHGLDTALDTLVVVWDAQSYKKLPAVVQQLFTPIQWFVWFFVVLPIAVVGVILNSIVVYIMKRDYLLASLIVLRSVIVTYYLGHTVQWLPGVTAIVGFGIFGALNHNHLPKLNHAVTSYVESMVIPTENLAGGICWRWLSGHLDLHIEHHLFPTLPRFNLHKIQSEVRELCRRHNIEYKERAVSAVWSDVLCATFHPQSMHTDEHTSARCHNPAEHRTTMAECFAVILCFGLLLQATAPTLPCVSVCCLGITGLFHLIEALLTFSDGDWLQLLRHCSSVALLYQQVVSSTVESQWLLPAIAIIQLSTMLLNWNITQTYEHVTYISQHCKQLLARASTFRRYMNVNGAPAVHGHVF